MADCLASPRCGGSDAGRIMSAVATEIVPSANSTEAPEPPREGLKDDQRAVRCEPSRAESANPLLKEAQRHWAARPLADRLQVVRKTRQWMAGHPMLFAEAISPALHRSQADTLLTELLPVLDAMRFLERSARRLLAPHVLGRRGRPLLLTGVRAEVHRIPVGHVLVIGPANYPLYIPAVQTLQALVAGNAVTWKPGTGGRQLALLVAHALGEAGLPRGVLHITEETVEAAQGALASRPDKVVFTGSFESGKTVMRALAETATPSVMELSGADAVVLLPSADLALAAKAVAFGLRLNGAEVCMSPRRLIAAAETMRALRPLLQAELERVPPVALKPDTASALLALVDEARDCGARVGGEVQPRGQRPLLVEAAGPQMRIANSDIFAPVISLIEASSVLHIPEIVNDCAYGLTAAIFGEVSAARALGEQLRVGTVLVNDLIAPTVDPRVPFGGRGSSGFGATRGAEGLLEMTTPKTVLIRRKGLTKHYDAVGPSEAPLFAALIKALHGASAAERMTAVRELISGVRKSMAR